MQEEKLVESTEKDTKEDEEDKIEDDESNGTTQDD